jgi:hypothetical protein
MFRPVLKLTARESDEMSGCTTPIALRGTAMSRAPVSVSRATEAGARHRAAQVAGTDTLADDCKSLETTCDQGFRAIAVFDFSENVTFGPS